MYTQRAGSFLTLLNDLLSEDLERFESMMTEKVGILLYMLV